jgi:acetyl-CoA C-acetyltransferase
MQEVYILSAVRTPIGKFGGALSSFSATQLGAKAIQEAILRAGISKSDVDEVIMGCVLQANVGQAPARQAAIFSGLPAEVRCTTVNKVCASGMKAISMGVQSILLGDADVVIAGGMESMSNVPFYIDSMRWGNKYGDRNLIDGISKDGLTDAYDNNAMGIAAELCAEQCNISRADQDEFAIESYHRSQKASTENKFKKEIVPIIIESKKGSTLVDQDEEPFSVNFDKIPTLKPAFKENGTVTAANASTMNDGAAALVLMKKEKADKLGLKPIASIIGYADAEQEPAWFTTTPSIAIPIAVEKSNLTMDKIDYWEINEAFSVVGIENSRRLNLDTRKVNVHGGAVSLGHPLGCSGARIIVSLIHILHEYNGTFGAAGICNGGGGASAMVIKKGSFL